MIIPFILPLLALKELYSWFCDWGVIFIDIQHLDRPGVSFCSRTTYDDNAITNAVEIYGSPRYFFFLMPVIKLLTSKLNLINLVHLILSGAVHFTASNNDCGVRDFDMGKYQLSKHFRFPWPVNVSSSYCIILLCRLLNFMTEKVIICLLCLQHSSQSPDGKLLIIVGDNPDGLLVDSMTGKAGSSSLFNLNGHMCSQINSLEVIWYHELVINWHLEPEIKACSNLSLWSLQTTASLCGHLDFSFASAWHPNGVTFATGNQDKTCRIWDLRNLSESVAVLKGNLGAIRSIRYTSDGRYMATAEPADFVHVYDVKSGYEKEQEIDFFGEISGISFSPDTESLFIGVWDRTYGSLLEYGRCRNYSYLDSLIWVGCAICK